MKALGIILTGTTLAVTVACTSAPSPAQVVIDTFRYEPGTLTVSTGTPIQVRNHDQILHTVTAGTPDAPSQDFDVTLDGAGTTATFTVTEPGTYPYFCMRHPTAMTGTLVVR